MTILEYLEDKRVDLRSKRLTKRLTHAYRYSKEQLKLKKPKHLKTSSHQQIVDFFEMDARKYTTASFYNVGLYLSKMPNLGLKSIFFIDEQFTGRKIERTYSEYFNQHHAIINGCKRGHYENF